jgi:hypothetical protein
VETVGLAAEIDEYSRSRRRVPADRGALPAARGRPRPRAYGRGSAVAKTLIVDRELVPGRTTVVLVDEALGY